MATLKSLVDETTNIKNELKICHSNLKNNLIEKGVKCSATDKMSNLIDKVSLLDNYVPNPLYLYKSGDENIDITGGWILPTSAPWGEIEAVKRPSSIYMKLTPNSNTNTVATLKPLNSIDFSMYSKLHFDVAMFNKTPGNVNVLSIRNSSGTIIASYNINSGVNSSRKIITLDVSTLHGKYDIHIYLVAYTFGSGNYFELELFNCYAER